MRQPIARLHPVEGRRGEHAVEGPLGKLDVLEASDVEAHERGVADAPAGDLDHPRAGIDRVDAESVRGEELRQLPGAAPDLDDLAACAEPAARHSRVDEGGGIAAAHVVVLPARRRRRPCQAWRSGAADDTVGGYAAGAGLARF